MEDILRVLDRNSDITVRMPLDGYFSIGDAPMIRIESSSCLIDPDIPLRYSLQNAFDGDPATSYVENTEDDLMQIWVYIKSDDLIRCAIINGYAQNMTLYKNNNRIKSLWVDNYTTELHDNILSYQFLNNAYKCLYISDIFKGAKYNDTCLAEYNVYIRETGWLFGDIDE
jgi:hypothetical protein